MSKALKDILNNDKKFNDLAKSAFDSVDTDRSGQIDAEELEKVMKMMASDMGYESPSKEEILEVFYNLDTDNSGKIDFLEFKMLIKDVLEVMIESADY